ncbi:phosphate signaling complex PhoU family protein [Methanoplanus limicola]|uniref:Phosphate uptake regulator, PhoU n=1 Tax=Methanoplanus limicola DSM 2279 TaxID=937775 RepID=H1YYD1_9EURY|nr:phosphate uptake regulator PhoU [Methanoplanus limicola]EHQ34226.1 phosphate uptake regulator, PhoU [Methanoplanus limicola DSM 2279]
MEIRKVQITGGSSYIVSLPKEWIRESDIKKNDPLGLIVQPDGTLTITPRLSGKTAEREKEFNMKEIRDPDVLYRLLIGAYVTGYNRIIIKAQTRLPSFAHRVVRMFIQVSIGQEVSEETERTIVIKDLLNPGEMPFENIISRMIVIIEGMTKDSLFALKTRDSELTDDIILRDRDINRLYWLISRQYNLLLKNVSLSREMGINVDNAIHYLQVSRVLERVGDQIVHIAENVKSLLYTPVERKMMDSLTQLSYESINILNSSVKSFYNEDINLTNNTLTDIKEFRKKCDKISYDLFDTNKPGIVPFAYIIENFKRVSEYSGVICETSINYYVMNSE